jgi:hypothetical protein
VIEEKEGVDLTEGGGGEGTTDFKTSTFQLLSGTEDFDDGTTEGRGGGGRHGKGEEGAGDARNGKEEGVEEEREETSEESSR